MKPAEPGKAFVPVDLAAIQDAICWLRPDEREQITPEAAGKAVGIVSNCAAAVNFGPSTYASHLMRLLAEREARSVVSAPGMTH